MRRRDSFLLLLISAAGAALLVTLAILQYRWLSQLSAAEGVRMRRHLHGAATQLARDLDAEIARAHTQIQLGRAFYQDDPEGEYADRYANWANNNPNRGIVHAVYVVRVNGEDLVLRRLDPATGRFADAQWPAALSGVRQQISERARRGDQPGPPWQPGGEVTPLVLAAPHFNMRPPRFARRRDAGPPRLRAPLYWCIVELDAAYIRQTFLPVLVRKHLGRDGALDYRVQVVESASNVPLYDSASSAPWTLITQPDVSVPLLNTRPGPFFRREANLFNRPPGLPSPGPAAEEGAWRLLLVHHAGSLEAVVGAVRHRNLAIGFGVLALLAAAIAALLIALRRAQLLAQLQLEFVAGVSHELRTPLSVIRSAGENLADGVTTGPEAVRRYGALVRDEGRRLSEMVEQILTFARASSVFERHPAKVSELVERAVQACAHEINDAGCEVATDLDPDLPSIDVDATALVHALRNLVSNAAMHGGRGGPIHLRAWHEDGTVEIEVSDRGPGIEPGDLRRIFDPFYRGHRARENQTRGLGLGLSLVKRIVQAHGGSIAAASNPGQGACFTVRLPAAKPSPA
jgi:signal transduction histidine kinase